MLRCIALIVLFISDIASAFSADISSPNAEFIQKHWQQPLRALSDKNTSATSNTKLHKHLLAQSCGQCHTSQYNDWRNSVHAKAVGDGVMGQIKLHLSSSEQALKKGNDHFKQPKCLQCHAPLAEQNSALKEQFFTDDSINLDNPLHEQGVVCASCHMRNGIIYGPELTGNLITNTDSDEAVQHAKPVTNTAFSYSMFCASCHQFKADGPKLEGKLIQNTYNEWQESKFAQQNISCQNCHMPARRHLFQGIHSKEMVLQGLTINASLNNQNNNVISASLQVINSGVGHYFPTYVTPRVILKAYQQDQNKTVIPNSIRTTELMRAVSLDLADEYFDTRLAPSEDVIFDYNIERKAGAASMIYQIIVEPDYFYQHFFREKLIELEDGIKGKGIAELKQAKNKAEGSAYLLYEKTFQLN